MHRNREGLIEKTVGTNHWYVSGKVVWFLLRCVFSQQKPIIKPNSVGQEDFFKINFSMECK